MKIRHPSDNRTRTIDADRFEVYRSQGWVEVKAAKKADPKPADPEAVASDDK